ncbi:MAG: hypothetical protein ACI9V8_002227 [Urechidicola sp.]|jgi:hypothetical protein
MLSEAGFSILVLVIIWIKPKRLVSRPLRLICQMSIQDKAIGDGPKITEI